MALEGLRGYLELASGLTLASRQRAREVAGSLVSSSGLQQAVAPLSGQVQQIAEELVATSRANRDLLMTLVRAEVDRAVAALGVPSAEEVRRLDRRVRRLEEAVAAEGSPVRAAAAKRAGSRATSPDGTGGTEPRAAAPRPTRAATTTRSRATRPPSTAAGAGGASADGADGTDGTDGATVTRRATRPAGAPTGGTEAGADGAAGTTTTGPAPDGTGATDATPEAGP